jgi:hypothetical protein
LLNIVNLYLNHICKVTSIFYVNSYQQAWRNLIALFMLLLLCISSFGIQYNFIQEKHWCKASKGVQARNAASEDQLVDIWWQDILINFSMVNWFLPEWTDERHCSLWTLIGMLEIRILLIVIINSNGYKCIQSFIIHMCNAWSTPHLWNCPLLCYRY